MSKTRAILFFLTVGVFLALAGCAGMQRSLDDVKRLNLKKELDELTEQRAPLFAQYRQDPSYPLAAKPAELLAIEGRLNDLQVKALQQANSAGSNVAAAVNAYYVAARAARLTERWQEVDVRVQKGLSACRESGYVGYKAQPADCASLRIETESAAIDQSVQVVQRLRLSDNGLGGQATVDGLLEQMNNFSQRHADLGRAKIEIEGWEQQTGVGLKQSFYQFLRDEQLKAACSGLRVRQFLFANRVRLNVQTADGRKSEALGKSIQRKEPSLSVSACVQPS